MATSTPIHLLKFDFIRPETILQGLLHLVCESKGSNGFKIQFNWFGVQKTTIFHTPYHLMATSTPIHLLKFDFIRPETILQGLLHLVCESKGINSFKIQFNGFGVHHAIPSYGHFYTDLSPETYWLRIYTTKHSFIGCNN